MFNDIFDEIRKLQREINRSFGDFWDTGRMLPDLARGELAMRTPLTDIEEKEKEIIAKIELPGVEKKDIQLNVTENRLEVKVEKKEGSKIEKKGSYKEERSYRGFYRLISLPSEVIPEKAKAKYKDGILEVVIPKAEKKKSKINIE